jgi:hypothetical protein
VRSGDGRGAPLRAAAAVLAAIGSLLPEGAKGDDTAGGWLDRVRLSTLIESSLAVQTADGVVQKSELVLTPELQADLAGGVDLTAITRLRGDASDRLEPGKTSQDTRAPETRRLFLGDDVDAELRELYVDIDIDAAALRIGKQQIVWGEADGLKVLDQVDPQSYREFVLPDFDDSRIPLWSLNAEVPLADMRLQLLWVPDTTYDDIPERDAAFAFRSPLLVPQPPPGVPVDVQDPRRPDDPLTDADAGLRLSGMTGGWQFSLNYLYHFYDRPAALVDATATGLRVTPKYRRTHLVGGSVNNAFGDVVLRGEVAYSSDRYFPTDASDADGVARSDEIGYVLGLDWSGLADTLVSGQVFQSVIADHQQPMAQDQVETILTLLVRRSFLNETVRAEVFHFQSMNEGDVLFRARLAYDLYSNVEVSLGTDIFFGDRDGLFGQYENRDRVVFGMTIGL